MPYNENMRAAIAYTSGYAKRVAKILREEERDAMEFQSRSTRKYTRWYQVQGAFKRHGGAAKERASGAAFG
jgi:hypothetical protein